MKILASIILIVTAFFFTSCKDNSTSSDSGNPPANEVWIQNNAFNPASITVTKGSMVKWTNKDAVTHTATSTTPLISFDSGNLAQGQSFSFKFDSTGTFSYHCKIHTGMIGSVKVQ